MTPARIPALSTPSPGPLVPAILAMQPNAVRLVKSLGRCWGRATLLGILCAATAAVATWFLMPPTKATARTLVRVPPGGIFLFRTAENVPALVDHQRNQVAMIKSRLVLSSALKQPEVGRLGIVQKWSEPIEWLEKEIQADFAVAPEIVRIGLSGDNPDELKTLVNAVRVAYCTEILDRERQERIERLTKLGQLRERHQEMLRAKRNDQRTLEQAAGGKDQGVRGLLQTFMNQQLTSAERELLQVQADLRRYNGELEARKAEEAALATAVPPALLGEMLNRQPAVQRAVEGVNWLRQKVDVAAARGPKDPDLPGYGRQLADAEEALKVVRRRLTPEATEKVRAEILAENARHVRQAEAQIAALRGTEKVLLEQVELVRGRVQSMVRNAAQLDATIEGAAQVEDIAKRVADEEARLRIEVQEAPERYRVLEEAVVTRPLDDKRLFLACAAAFVGVFSLVLFSIALREFRARRVGAVEEVVHGLGINLVGAIPDASAKAYGKRANAEYGASGLLTEAIDATRTQLLCAARDESLRVLMVTSAGSGEGKTSLSTHLAASLAQVGHRTLLIDGDLRHPVVHRMFELESEPGFSELLRGEARPEDVIVQTAIDNLSILPAGRWDPTASRALAREEVLGPMLEELRGSYDFVVIDTSPVLLVTDALIMGQHADGTILSVLRGVSRIPSVYAARERLAAAGVCVLGAVVNGVRSDTAGDYYYAAPAGAPSGGGDK